MIYLKQILCLHQTFVTFSLRSPVRIAEYGQSYRVQILTLAQSCDEVDVPPNFGRHHPSASSQPNTNINPTKGEINTWK